jgi:hypothetical protein
MSVIVTSSVPVGAAATVRLTGQGSFQEQTATASFGATLTFTELPPGTYTLTTTAFGFSCQPVSATVQSLETTTVNITCTRTSGTLTGTVTSGGSPIIFAIVSATRSGVVLTRTTGANGTFTFAVPAGEYEVTVSHQHHNCPIQTALVGPDETTTVDIPCIPKTTGSIQGNVIVGLDPGFTLSGVTVSVSGPESHTATSGGNGSFLFDELTPGMYTVTSTSTGLDCQLVSADVQAAQTTTVEVSCAFRLFPFGTEISGNWFYFRQSGSQTGSCPATLPDQGEGSMTFNPGDGTIEILGLDPELRITGPYDEESGIYTGSGTTVLGDGSTIRTDVSVTFFFDFEFGFGDLGFFSNATQSLTRQHRDPSGNLFCTEDYQVGGFRVR